MTWWTVLGVCAVVVAAAAVGSRIYHRDEIAFRREMRRYARGEFGDW